MPKKRTQLIIALAAIFVAVLAAVVAYTGISARVSPVSVVEAATQVPPMTRISASDLTVVSVPKGQLTSAQYLAGSLAGALVGHYTVYGLYPGELVVPADIAAATPQTSTYDARLMELRQQAEARVAAAEAALTKLGASLTATGAVIMPNTAPPPAKAVPSRGRRAATSTRTAAAAGSGAAGSGAASSSATAVAAAKAAYIAAVQHLATVRQEVAVTLQVSEQQGFALVHTGDHVTVFGTVHDSSQTTAAFGVANRVLVLGREGGSTGAAVDGAVSGLLVLALTPPQVERLMLSEQAGSLLVGLNPVGGGRLTIGTVTSTDLLGAAAAPQTSTVTTIQSANSPGAVVPHA